MVRHVTLHGQAVADSPTNGKRRARSSTVVQIFTLIARALENSSPENEQKRVIGKEHRPLFIQCDKRWPGRRCQLQTSGQPFSEKTYG